MSKRHGRPPTPADMNRRDALKTMGGGAFGLGAAYGVMPELLERFRRVLAQGQYEYRFFAPPELETMRMLADMIIPRDHRSASATDAGTVEYADFVLSEGDEETRATWRDGFAWLDGECWQRYGTSRFVECAPGERSEVLDAIAWPQRAETRYRSAVQWFNRVRDLVGSGFFSSEVGVEDVGYIGGVFNPDWRGAPPEVLEELGVSYDEWERRYGGAE